MKNLPVLCKLIFLFAFLSGSAVAPAQTSPLYNSLPVGKYAVGFKIFTITDSSRISKPEYNYLGEKYAGDRTKKITIHLWYPAVPNSGTSRITYGDYCYNGRLTSTGDTISAVEKDQQLLNSRGSVERWFGKTTDDAWGRLLKTPMLASINARPGNEKFPLLVGMLRTISTSVTNELLASNGYVVAMVIDDQSRLDYPELYLYEIPDMQFTISYLQKHEAIDAGNIGTFGFSGSGFTQVLFAMNDYRVKAVADIESGIYMDGLFQRFSGSNYYIPSKLQVPFLHIFSRDLSKEEKYIGDFENKTRSSKRYRLLLNQPKLHHWDSAAEGYSSCIILQNRGTEQANIKKSFEIESYYLLNFFNAELKSDAAAQKFMSVKPDLGERQPALWDISILEPVTPSPDYDEFEEIIAKKGIKAAVDIFNNTFKNDTSTNLRQGFMLNALGSKFLRGKQYEEAIAIFKLNIQLHPEDANLHDSLAEACEAAGDKAAMKQSSRRVIDILAKKDTLNDFEKGLKASAEKRLKAK